MRSKNNLMLAVIIPCIFMFLYMVFSLLVYDRIELNMYSDFENEFDSCLEDNKKLQSDLKDIKGIKQCNCDCNEVSPIILCSIYFILGASCMYAFTKPEKQEPKDKKEDGKNKKKIN